MKHPIPTGTIAELVERARRLKSDDGHRSASALAVAFHGIRKWPGVMPWDPDALYGRAIRGASEAERDAARFVLEVCCSQGVIDFLDHREDGDERPKLGRLHIVDAMARWDQDHRAAFLAWAKGPWWL